ncbi:hypothetical protein GCM10022219_22070 [Microbacterium oryzae]|uniref:Acyltransferase n=1 Tax=Microbacterium oryzae TaxID=743009 RepID=A0A6I6DXL0_9MICO|nr:acyltransferase [Microbacterium oryzae]QGU27563.1 acyltransferase [Microbacterium oryzae]
MPTKARLAWVDAARAFSIVAIVLVHIHLWLLPPIEAAYPETGIWGRLISITGAFRLPVLFALSGFLVAERVRSGWRERRNLTRILNSAYLYVIWLAIYALLSTKMPGSQPVGVPWEAFLQQLTLPQTPLWFVMFLAIHMAVITTCARLHPAVVLTATAILAWFSIVATFPPYFEMVQRGLYYLFFFALGVYSKELLTKFASRRGLLMRLVFAMTTNVLTTVAMEGLAIGPAYLFLILLRDVSAVLSIAAVMSLVCQFTPASRVLGFIGKRTLPVYVMHVPMIWALMTLRDPVTPALEAPLFRMAAPLIALALILGTSIALHAALRRLPLGSIFFELPRALTTRIAPREPAPRA